MIAVLVAMTVSGSFWSCSVGQMCHWACSLGQLLWRCLYDVTISRQICLLFCGVTWTRKQEVPRQEPWWSRKRMWGDMNWEPRATHLKTVWCRCWMQVWWPACETIVFAQAHKHWNDWSLDQSQPIQWMCFNDYPLHDLLPKEWKSFDFNHIHGAEDDMRDCLITWYPHGDGRDAG